MATSTPLPPTVRKPDARANLRTALTLASVAVVFFIGVFVARLLGTPTMGFSVLGLLVTAFLVFAIVRHLRGRE